MVLGVSKKRVVFVSSLLAALTTILITTLKFNGVDSHAASSDATKTITITKQWVGDTVSNRPSDITVYLNKTSSTLLPGCQSSSTTLCPGGSANTLEAKMKSLAGNGGFNSANTTITAIKKATNAQYEAKKSSLTSTNEVQASGEKTYMWFESGTIYFYSLADNIYLSPNSAGAFRRLSNLTDISGLAHFNTTYVTDMNRMFQDTPVISDISYLSNWDTGNVLDMTYMFGSNFSGGACVSPMNFSNLTPLANWNVSNVTSMDQMFKCNAQLANLTPLTNWDVTNVTNMNQMFNRSGVTSIDPVKDWNVINVEKATSGNKGFVMMFGNTPVISNYSSMPQFTKRPGSWASNGGYTPTAQPSGAVAKP
ncbi:BspA family leucine-rich repeat surface protein, partial [Candidatus Saccharibacteria bacterium]|nr:BspA family leucine-rich repeat surface protein [Candidatus Saccharibacteria bacterium]